MKNVFKSVLFMLVLVLSAAMIYAAASAPAFSPAIGAKSVNEGQPLNFVVSSTAADVGAINFSVCLDAPCAGTKVNALSKDQQITIGSTKVNYSYLSTTQMGFNWTPDFTQSGTYKFRFNVTDDDTNNSFEDVTVTVVDVPPKLAVTSTLTLGSETQERSDPNHDTEDKREVNLTGTITLKNDGPEQLNGLKGTVSVASGFTESDLKINFTLPKTTLAVGESVSVPISVRVPQKLNAVTKALVASAVNVGSIKFEATPSITGGAVSGTTQLEVRAENNLKLKDVKVRFDGKSENVDNGDNVKDLKPGMNIEIEIEVENRFKSKEDVTIEDVEVKVISNGELDIDESEDLGDLGAEDKDTIKVESVIDDDADDGTFSVEISAEGTDEFGARHGEKISVDFEIKRKSHEIEIKSVTLNPPTVSCEKETKLTANLRNSGRRDEEDVLVRLASPELSFGAVSDKLSLDQDDEDSVSFTVPVAESITRPANYRVTVDTYFNTDTKSNSEVVLLSVAKCGAEDEKEKVTPPEEGKKDEVTVITVPPTQPQVNVTPQEQPAAKKSFLETPQYVALLVLGYVVVLGGGAALLIKLMKPQ
ncbi:hypothetical protein HYV85_03445 [Candidatus Woesearchaeota archaeon]|nr:hypothetical protein [Candidatus Woesearchaeota archaeon]